MGKIRLLLCGLVALAAGCISSSRIAGQAQSKPQPKSKASVFIEETITKDNLYHFINLDHVTGGGAKSCARVLVTDGKEKDKVEYGVRSDVNFGSFTGNAEMIGFDDFDGNHGVGLNARGKIGKTKVGIALENKVEGDDTTNMAMAYASRTFGNIGLTGGISDTNGNTTGIFSADCNLGQNIFGAGVNVNGKGKGFGTAVVGRFPRTKGQGFGCRLWTRNDFEGNYLVDFLASTNSTISIHSDKAMISPDDGCLDPKSFQNLFDTQKYLWQNTSPGGIVGNAKHVQNRGTGITSLDALYQFPEKRGVSPRVGVGYKTVDTGAQVSESVTGTVGASFSNGGYLDVKFTDSEGNNSYSVIGGLSINF